jgi:hypothetical protein
MSTLRYTSPALEPQRLAGTIMARLIARSSPAAKPQVWTLNARVVSAEGYTRPDLLPTTTGETRVMDPGPPGNSLFELTLGPIPLSPANIHRNDRILVLVDAPELELSTEGRESWIEFSQDLKFRPPFHPTQRVVGQCIYCSTRKRPLNREHIIPLGLNGELLLLEASCPSCERITARFERDALRSALIGPRTGLRMRTRRRSKRPEMLPLIVERGGHRQQILIPTGEYPAFLATPVFAPPAHLSGVPYTSGITVRGVGRTQVAGLPLSELQRKYECEYAGVQIAYQPIEFARLVAKMAYGYAVMVMGLRAIASAHVLPAILGDLTDIGRWVGSVEGKPVGPRTGLHALSLIVNGGEIHVFVRLFAQFNMHEYVVVVGRVN